MKGDLTAEPNTHAAEIARADTTDGAWRFSRSAAARLIAGLLGAAVLGALLVALCAQLPARHVVDVGGYDAAYVQGFHDPERPGPSGAAPYLDGSDGAARWSRDVSYLVFPQAGLPAEVTLRLRGRAPGPEVRVLLNGEVELGRFRASDGWEERTFAIRSGLRKPSDVVIELRAEAGRLSESDPRAVGVLLDRAMYRSAPPPATPYPAQLAYGALVGAMLYLLCGKALTINPAPVRGKGEEPQRAGTQPPLPGQTAGGRGGEGRSMLLRHLARADRRWLFGLALAAFGTAYLFLYRLQPAYPYPLRGLPQWVCLALAGLLALRYAPLVARRAWLLDAAALGGIGAWLAAVLAAAERHLVLSSPGVEKDFRVFATRAFDLGEVFRADDFYNLGYPLLLWLATPLTQGNPFLAARTLAALSGAALLAASWWIARTVLGRGPALLALAALALSPLVVQYALYVGSDMPFAALCALALALLIRALNAGGGVGTFGPHTISFSEAQSSSDPPQMVRLDAAQRNRGLALSLAAGLAAGAAFLVRHPGIVLLPVGWMAIVTAGSRLQGEASTSRAPHNRRRSSIFGRIAWFTLGFLVAAAPQLAVNLRDTGQPLYSQQAKNVWLAVYGDGDWGRWGEARNDISLAEVALQDPGRFLAAWWANVRGFFGTGAEDTSEFGRAIQLRLLGFPANWLALAGLLGWVGALLAYHEGTQARRHEGSRLLYPSSALVLLGWLGIYVAAVSVGLALQRFFLPLAPVYAVAAAWSAAWLARRLGRAAESRAFALVSLLLLALLWGGFATGADYVLRRQPDIDTPGQPAETLEAAQLVRQLLRAGERLALHVDPDDDAGLALGKYSAIAHLAVPAPESTDATALRAAGAHYLLWSGDLGPAPPVGETVGRAGRYTVIHVHP
ncbi:MAG TPA: glycosyltransferase family 39 protein [Roseiflexaceae bacterium]|nr:glycosyltransferase family 39 protein [Roseiflexaceae bacterium]